MGGTSVVRVLRARLTTGLALVLMVAGLTLGAGAPASAATQLEVGFVGPGYGGNASGEVPPPPTEQKAQSKLWYAKASWWGALWDEGTGYYSIWRYDWSANSWIDTGTRLDGRSRTDMDVLWNGTHLYVLSNGTAAGSATNDARLSRYSFDSSTGAYVADWAAPISVVPGLTYSPVLDQDSTGTLWITYTTGTKVMLTHSMTDDKTWATPYQLPTDHGESTVSYDTSITPDDAHGSSDISAVVAFGGNRVGVLWSNQVTMKMYWAVHQDGAGDQDWNLDVAYDQPKGADDHINLKSVTGLDGGSVFAVTKTSMTGADNPLINVLQLKNGAWSAHEVWSTADDLTRAQLLIDRENRRLYVFAAGPTNDGGAIYYKTASMADPSFSSGMGTPFIRDAAYPNINNPTTTKQTVNSDTDILVLAANHPTKTYLYNRIDIGPAAPPPADTTPPDTTITAKPDASTTDTSASFSFNSTEQGSTFECKLDAAAYTTCSSPKTYTGLTLGSHTFGVRAVDAAGNRDASPATATWTVVAPADTAAPDTTITAKPAASTTDTSASFSFSSTEQGSTFECKLDGAAYTTCSSPKAYTGLTPGSHTFSVRATDAAGNTDATPASFSWTVVAPTPPPSGGGGGTPADTTPPETTITSSPASSTGSTTARFSFTSSEQATFECKLDGGSYTACVSPKSYSGLAFGSHTFAVRAVDAAKNVDASPASYTWTVVAPAPRPSGRLFADDFSSGDFAAGGWRVRTRDGSATVAMGAARSSDLGAVLRTRARSGSKAVISKSLDVRQRDLRIEWRGLVTREAARGHVAQLLRVRDNHGRVVLTLVRVAGSGRLAVVDRRGDATWAGRLRIDRARLLSLTVHQKKGHDAWTLSIGSRVVASDSDARTGNRALRGMTFGAQGAGRLIYGIDDVTVSAP